MKNTMNFFVMTMALALSPIAALAATDPAASSSSAEVLTEYTKNRADKNFTGSPINLQLKDADVREVLRMIGDASGFNIVVHPSVTGKISISLEQVPWDQALDVVLNTMGLAADRSNSVLRVMPRDMLITEKQTELNAKRLSAEAAPKITRIFPISYAELSSLVTVLQSFLNAQSKSPDSASTPGLIIPDSNTNSVVVRDSAENVDRVKKMIDLLDIQTPQVLIEAKVVEASSGFSSSIGGNLGLTDRSRFLVGFNGNDPTSNLAGRFTTTGGGTLVGANGLGAAIEPSLGFLNGNLRLNALLNMSEQKNEAKVVSSPKLVVISGKQAEIKQATTAMVQVQTIVNGNPVISLTPIAAETKLNVTPRVTNDGSVYLKLDLARGILRTPAVGNPTVDPRTMNTEVIIDSGGTIVIGGIFSQDNSSGESGVPYLRKIPILGWLFGNETKVESKVELMFFITPRVLNPKKSGLQVSEG